MSAADTPSRPTAAELLAMGLSKGFAYDLANGRARPSLELAARVEREHGFPAAAWIDPSPTEAAA